MDLKRALGIDPDGGIQLNHSERLIQYINLKLAALGEPVFGSLHDKEFIELARDLIYNHQEKNRLLSNYLCPADQRIQNFINNYFSDTDEECSVRIPSDTFILDHHGIARMLSIPPDQNEYHNGPVSSYRIEQGILHNPKHDRRTTKGVFHVSEGGLPIPDDKKAVPKETFRRILKKALEVPKEIMELPFTASQDEKAYVWTSLLLRPTVVPEVPGYNARKSMEIRFFAPGCLVSNLDFVESIFGNAGDPYLPQNDAALDIDHWTGHTGCVIMAPHLNSLTKKEVGLPPVDNATKRQKRDGMCWEKEDELYNDGQPFKITARTDEGVILTILSDNYFGYSKKEVKTQISFSANLYGNSEEEHAGGALVFPTYDLGDEFRDDNLIPHNGLTFSEMASMYKEIMEEKPEGYAVDKTYPEIRYVPEDIQINLKEQAIRWKKGKKPQTLKLLPDHIYVMPSGYQIRMIKQQDAPFWQLIGTVAEGTFIHKPCTVSGGGKSEISKSIANSIIYGPFFVADIRKDFKLLDEIIKRDYSTRFKDPKRKDDRPFLDPERSMGSVIKLLTPSEKYTDEYNKWLQSIPMYVKGLVFIVKRFYKKEWADNWREHFTVDSVNGKPGNELRLRNHRLYAAYLRVGFEKDGSWRTYKLRQDFVGAHKLQMEDDITASTVVPARELNYLNPDYDNPSVKITENCEYRFFQRPDEAINRGYDKQAEADLAKPNTFISNFQPLTPDDAREIMENAILFDKYTEPMKKIIRKAALNPEGTYFVSSSHPRIVNGKPGKNVRYLQDRSDILNPRERYLAQMGIRLYRKIPADSPVYFPVNTVLPGRRNNPPEPGIRPLAVYNPIHYQELPELFMDFICSLTGKSPSTTGAGSEGALTKAPFNALVPTSDLNNALVSFILTGYDGFTTAAGYVGPKYRVDHDISLLVPEIWCRLKVKERDPEYMKNNGYLEKIRDFKHKGKMVYASRLGYRITEKFVQDFFGRVFEDPHTVFNEEMLKPELQSMDDYVDGILNITEAQERVAKSYFNDGSVAAACPPLKALLDIMVYGNHQGKTLDDPEIRNMFTLEYLLSSEWYRERLMNKQLTDIAHWQQHITYLKHFLKKTNYTDEADRLGIRERLDRATEMLERVKSPFYLKRLKGTLGADMIYKE